MNLLRRSVLSSFLVVAAAGSYTLHWSVRTITDVRVMEGDIPFTVKKP